jgi:hypothetical protein
MTVVVLTLPAGCYLGGRLAEQPVAGPGPTLNSDRIRQQFGSYGVKVLRQDQQLRVSNLYSVHAERSICRTFAVVRFVQPTPAELAVEHAAIVAGGSIGEVLRQHGWQVDKRRLQLTALEAAPQSEPGRLMGLAEPTTLATDVYQLMVRRGTLALTYAVIAEIHHPDYLHANTLEAMVVAPATDGNGDELLRLAEQFLAQGPLLH